MPRFLAVYTMKPEALAHWYTRPQSERDAIDAEGLKRWSEWEAANAASVPDTGGMVGRTMRVTGDGAGDARNDLAGWLVVEAADIEAAAALFTDHPHFAVFPGDGVDLMPILTGAHGQQATGEDQ